MAGKKGRSGRPRKNVLYLRSKNLDIANQIINRFLLDETIPDKDKIELASKLTIKDMGIQANKENTKLLTQNNFFTQIISDAAKEVQKITNTPTSSLLEAEARVINPDFKLDN